MTLSATPWDAKRVSDLARYLREEMMGKVLREAQLQPLQPTSHSTAAPAQSSASSIEATLQERGSRYGSFEGHALIAQGLKKIMQGTANWVKLADDQREALEMIAHKIGRILNGDPNYHDSWHDIVGYTKLVADRLATGKGQ